ncbi:hypothetical protein [Brumimicrobium aurantiacum]|uniref:HEAT repeat domain-containing protein n=1 Tax=Brumimicrobium aurantiacum TaxID=1737063 RepID=A0A3E1EWV2_9FLAO|nr:hypothetical protein [Brumimicrobium aurantiacum]RFC54029.1 hypothetical protein DXU93_10850 [Brumimicrobium aurantiacum]
MKTTPLESILTKSYKQEMLDYMEANPQDFNELVELAITNKQPYSWRAAWLLWSCMKKNDEMVAPHIGRLIKGLDSFKDGHQRNLINILLKMDIPEDYEGQLFDICVNLWMQIEKQSSVRIKAFEVMVSLAKTYPELQHEIKALASDEYIDALSGGIRKSCLRLLGEL